MMYGIPFFAAEVRYIDTRGALWSTGAGDPEYRIARWDPGGGHHAPGRDPTTRRPRACGRARLGDR